MISKKLTEFTKNQVKRIQAKYKLEGERAALAQMVKLQEETGELAAEVLHSQNLQRKSKTTAPEKLSEEIADVIITTLVLATTLKIDVNKALQDKSSKILKRQAQDEKH